MITQVNGQAVAQGSGAACAEGGPLQALAWLANDLNGRGLSLPGGMVCSEVTVAGGLRVARWH